MRMERGGNLKTPQDWYKHYRELKEASLDDVIEGLIEDDKLHFNHPLLNKLVIYIADGNAKVKV